MIIVLVNYLFLLAFLSTSAFAQSHKHWLIAPRPSAQSFIPYTNDMLCWLKADEQVYNDGDPVTTWYDATANDIDFVAATTQRPTFKANIQNGLAVIRFDGTGNRMNKGGLGTVNWTTYQGMQILAVAKVNAYAAYDMIYSATDGGSYWELRESNTANKMEAQAKLSTLATGTQDITANFDVWGYSFDVNTDQLELTYYFVTNALNSVAVASFGTLNMYIGGRNASGYFDGDIAEVMIYTNVLTFAQRSNTVRYLTNKWALHQ